jgi:small-conductance mechanosensitive channel
MWSDALHRLSTMGADLVASIPNIVVGVLVFAVFWVVGKLIRKTVHRVTMRRFRRRNVVIVMGRMAEGSAFFFGLLVAAVVIFPGFTPASLIQLLGISSVAIGFAFRDILQNYLAGILILLTEPFRIGDQILYQSYEGTVDDVQTRATYIRTYDGRRVVIPNGQLFTNAVIVNTAFEKRRMEYDVSIGYGDDIEKARKLILTALDKVEDALPDPQPEVLVYELAASAVVLRARWWIEPPLIKDVFYARDKVVTAIKRTLVENGIDLPFPTTQVLFHDQTEDTDGDRRRQREGWPAGDEEPPAQRSIAQAVLHAVQRQGKGTWRK